MSKSFSMKLLDEARDHFINGDYKIAEPLLMQPTLINSNNPEVYQMLATIFYNRGHFNKAVKTFKKALEIDSDYGDAAVGLSIILNDLGKYDEAKKVFEKAQAALQKKKLNYVSDNLDEKFAIKHIELGDMYLHYQRFEEALLQYRIAQKQSSQKADITLSLVECYLKSNQSREAIVELRSILQAQPHLHRLRIKLGMILYNQQKIAEAVDQWEYVLKYEPKNEDVVRYLKMAQASGITDIQL